jgi:hypothetical protein
MAETFTNQDNPKYRKKRYLSVNSIEQKIYNPRLSVPTFTYSDIIPYGDLDNLYPQKVIEISQKSWALSTALATYKDFIIGNGFNANNEIIINDKEQTLFDLLGFIAGDKSKLAIALHFNYNALGQIVEMQQIDVEDLRYNSEKKLIYNKDWSNRGAHLDSEVIYNLFDPEKALSEAKEVGFENYTGQVLYWTGQNKIYPLATFDAALESGQYQYDQELFKLRNIQNGFSLSGAFVYPKNIENQTEGKKIKENLEGDGTGANNSGRIMMMGVNQEKQYFLFLDSLLF